MANQPDKTSAWQQSENFIVKDFSSGDPVISFLSPDDVLPFVAEAAADGRKFVVYALGPCLLDYTANGKVSR